MIIKYNLNDTAFLIFDMARERKEEQKHTKLQEYCQKEKKVMSFNCYIYF
jgi:hypothetical protein